MADMLKVRPFKLLAASVVTVTVAFGLGAAVVAPPAPFMVAAADAAWYVMVELAG